jgi:flavin reductase (DIM6/NTAB) family NADH-FMN oxidoreductase RutF
MITGSPAAQSAYVWPEGPLDQRFPERMFDGLFRAAPVDESIATVGADSRWPAFFPAPIGFLTTGTGVHVALERVVGPVIVNRFPLVMAVSVCRETLSERHYARVATMETLEQTGTAAMQFLAPGPELAATLGAIGAEPDAHTHKRLARTGLRTYTTPLTRTSVLEDAYLVYEGRFPRPGTSLEGQPIYDRPWIDVASHRIYFLEVMAIRLRSTIARGAQQIAWHSLPVWRAAETVAAPAYDVAALSRQSYVKSYTPAYRFPSPGTVAFETEEIVDGMSVRHIEPLHGIPRAVDNDGARWPCFFPSSAGMLTAWQADGNPTAMPCGSTAIVSRLPFTVAACISNSAINERYTPRATLTAIRAARAFGVGVPYTNDAVVRAVSYLGNISARDDRDKVAHAGLTALGGGPTPVLAQLPIHLECRLTGEVALGTHVMVLGTVERVYVRRDVTPANPVTWQPWASIV